MAMGDMHGLSGTPPELVCVELPFLLAEPRDAASVRRKVLALLGGEGSVRNALAAEDRTGPGLHLFLQPECPQSHSQVESTLHMRPLHAVRLVRDKSTGELLRAELLGTAQAYHTFDRMADVVYRAPADLPLFSHAPASSSSSSSSSINSNSSSSSSSSSAAAAAAAIPSEHGFASWMFSQVPLALAPLSKRHGSDTPPLCIEDARLGMYLPPAQFLSSFASCPFDLDFSDDGVDAGSQRLSTPTGGDAKRARDESPAYGGPSGGVEVVRAHAPAKPGMGEEKQHAQFTQDLPRHLERDQQQGQKQKQPARQQHQRQQQQQQVRAARGEHEHEGGVVLDASRVVAVPRARGLNDPPPWCAALGMTPSDAQEYELARRIAQELRVRAVWTEDALRVRMSSPISHTTLSRVAYRALGGVFNGLWLRLGYDPRSGRDSLAWQLIELDCSQSLGTRLQALRVGPASPFRFCGVAFESSGALRAQLCDIDDELFQATLQREASASERQLLPWHPETGWISAESYARLRKLLLALAITAVAGIEARRAPTREAGTRRWSEIPSVSAVTVSTTTAPKAAAAVTAISAATAAATATATATATTTTTSTTATAVAAASSARAGKNRVIDVADAYELLGSDDEVEVVEVEDGGKDDPMGDENEGEDRSGRGGRAFTGGAKTNLHQFLGDGSKEDAY